MSGNKLGTLAFWALLLLSVSSCELFQPVTTPNRDDQRTEDRRAGNDDNREEPDDENTLDPIQSRRVYDPETGTYVYVENAPTDKMDTIRWTPVSEERNPPIVEDGNDIYTPIPVPGGTGDEDAGFSPITQIGTTSTGSRKLSGYNVDFVLPFLTDRYLGSEDEVDPNSQWALHFKSVA
ncbi:MAG: hypothetical protein AAFZ52_16845, partial [Bacteroidota bacterium]